MSSKKLYVIAGEASGDLHGSNLMKAILKEDHQTEFRFWGGDRMAEVQNNLVKHIRDLAFMGFWEVIKNLRTIMQNMKFCKQDILEFKPDAIVLIDYPGFNLRIAEWAHEHGIKVIYYISPQVWAWKQNRVHKIKKVVDKMFVILPFEEAFYEKFDYNVEYVGHPLLDEIEDFRSTRQQTIDDFRAENQLSEKPILAILPGSRKQEISVKLPIMLRAAENYKEMQVIVAGAPNMTLEFYRSIIGGEYKVVFDQTYNLLAHSHTAVVTSGTATLETGLFKVPQVVCYKGSNFSYQIAKRLVKIDFISLVNLIMGKEIVKELIQNECSSANIQAELDKLINDQSYRHSVLSNYTEMASKLGGGGASQKVAQSLLKTIQ
jgi:lipid-A-disaccharide synthase